MTDLFLEDDDADLKPGALEKLRAEVSRMASRLEHRLHDTASGAVEDARLLVRRTQSRINSRLGMAALAALGIGLVLGMVAALISARAAHDGDRDRR
jgi:hypothetical protein